LLDRSYVAGFDASRLLAARDEAFTAVCEKCVCDDEGSAGAGLDPSLVEDMQDAAFAILGIVQKLAMSDDASVPILALWVAAPPVQGQGNPDPTGLANNFNRWLFLQAMEAKADSVWTGLLSLANAGVPAQVQDVLTQTLHAIHAMINATSSPIQEVM